MSTLVLRPLQMLRRFLPNVRRNPKDAFLITLVLLLAALLLVSVTGSPGGQVLDSRGPTAGGAGGQSSAVQSALSDTSSPAGPAAQTYIVCTPNQVMTFKGRIHVHCTTAFSGISYFAVSTADPSYAARVLSVASTALVSGKNVGIWYDPADLSGAAIGCLNADCRLIIAIGF